MIDREELKMIFTEQVALLRQFANDATLDVPTRIQASQAILEMVWNFDDGDEEEDEGEEWRKGQDDDELFVG